jgi:hypothetical protein
MQVNIPLIVHIVLNASFIRKMAKVGSGARMRCIRPNMLVLVDTGIRLR